MNNIKKFDAYFSVNEGYDMGAKLKVSGNTLFIKVNDKVAKINMGEPSLNFTRANVESKKSSINADVYLLKYSSLKERLLKNEISVTIMDKSGEESDNIYLVVSTPKGEGGEVKFSSKKIIGSGGESTVVGKYDKTFGFYSLPNLDGLEENETKVPYTNIKFSNKKEAVTIEFKVETPFDRNSATLSFECKNQIKSELGKVSNKNVKIKIKTGISNDKKEGESEEESKTRLERDFLIVKRRYEAVAKYIKSLGFTTVIPIALPTNSTNTKEIYGKFNNNLNDPTNNRLEVETKHLKK